MKLFRRLYTSFRTKMLVLFVILTSIPLITVGIVSYQKSFHVISDHSKAANALVADQLRRDIDVLFRDTSRLLELENNQNVRHFLFSQSETYEDAKEILKAFKLYRETYKYNESVLNVTMINIYGKGISERKGVFQLVTDPLKLSSLNQLYNNPEKVLHLTPGTEEATDNIDGSDYAGRKVITIVATVKQPITHQVIGFIMIDLNDAIIEQFCDNVQIGDTGYFYVLNGEGRLIFQPDRLATGILAQPLIPPVQRLAETEGQYVDPSPGKPQFIVYTTSEETGWMIVGQVPLSEVIKEAIGIQRLIFVSVTLSIIFVVVLYFYITSKLTKPIQILKNKMRHAASGYLEAKVVPTGYDEIADLGNSFNIMLGKIKALLTQSIHEQEQIKKSELRTLQAQINPHFLYNTLDSILWLAEVGQNEKVIKLVQALSQFFRIGLNKGRDWITLQEELEHVRSYLTIQQMRYRDILQYEIEVPAVVHNVPILKMTLQPLVENAIYHGIKNRRGMGLIRIGCLTGSRGELLLYVEDNGPGMQPERLTAVRAGLHQQSGSEETGREDQGAGFGLRNVHQRLRLFHGDSYGLEIESQYQEGARILVRLPLSNGVNWDEKDIASG